MIHRHNSTDLFPTWYKSIDPAVDASTVNNRVTAINKILENKKTGFWFDVLRLALGIKGVQAATITALETEFKDADLNFPLTSNENLLQVLAQISLCFLFESTNVVKEKTASAVANAVFFGQFEKSEIPFHNYANELLSEQKPRIDEGSQKNREALNKALLGMEEDEEGELLMDYQDQLAIIKTVNYLYDQNVKLQQESNILWWLFGQYSSESNNYFTDLGPQKMILSTALELAGLNTMKLHLPSAKHLIQKALTISNDSNPLTVNINLPDAIEATTASVKNKILSTASNITTLTPCLLALDLSVQFADPAVWKGAFKAKIPGVDIDSEFNPLDIAFQIYNEIMFLTSN